MKQWPKIGSKVKFQKTHMFWFKNMVDDAKELLEEEKEYTVADLRLSSSWCSVVLEEFPNNKFPLSFFKYDKDLTTEEETARERKTVKND